jgi:hypothetical protein
MSSTEGHSVIFKKIGRAIFWVIECCGVLVASTGMLYLYISFLARLKFGIWQHYDLQMFWEALHTQWPNAEWLGSQKVIELVPPFLLNLPTWIVFLSLGGFLFILGLLGDRDLEGNEARAPLQTVERATTADAAQAPSAAPFAEPKRTFAEAKPTKTATPNVADHASLADTALAPLAARIAEPKPKLTDAKSSEETAPNGSDYLAQELANLLHIPVSKT